MPSKIGIILASTREGRMGERVATWAHKHFANQPEVEVEILDLKEYPLPFYEYNELPSALPNGYKEEVATRWHNKVQEMDGFVLVTPEYNHGYSGVLKNALDYISGPWTDKPVLIVSYSSGPIGGARVTEQLRAVLGYMRMVVLADATHIGRVAESISEAGEVTSGPYDAMLDKQIAQLIVWTKLLQQKRAQA